MSAKQWPMEIDRKQIEGDYFNQESERLKFRKLTSEDISSWIEFFSNNKHLKYLGIDLQKEPKNLATDWIQAQLKRYEDNGLGHLAIELKESQELIGMGGILSRELHGKQEYEIAYSLKPNYWGKGYATEIAVQMKKFGQNYINTQRLISIIHVENSESSKVAIKNQMEILFQTEFLGMKVDVYGINT